MQVNSSNEKSAGQYGLKVTNWQRAFQTKKSVFWRSHQTRRLGEIYNKLAREVPAYKEFLKAEGVRKVAVSKLEEALPAINKQNYFKKFFPQALRSKRDELASSTLTATSGSTGTPTYFYRDEYFDYTYSVYLEYFLKLRKPVKTLFIDCFGMGVWIGGLLTYTALRRAASQGYSVDIITPGVSFKDIFACLEQLTPQYESVIISGYPPFIKDILDNQRFPKKLANSGKLRFIFAAESFTEGFRDYVAVRGHVQNKYLDTMNIYGSAELGAMAIETPFSILIRELILKTPEVRSKLFVDGKIPTVAQYNPEFVSFTERQNRLLVSGDSLTPFLLYDIGDRGRVFTYNELLAELGEVGPVVKAQLQRQGLPHTELPFVFVFERADLSTSIYGLQIYPQHIKIALEKMVSTRVLTGKFVLTTKRDRRQNQYLELRAELQTSARASAKLKTNIAHAVLRTLHEINSEFRELSKYVPASRLRPKILLSKNGDAKFFPIGIKQKWVV